MRKMIYFLAVSLLMAAMVVTAWADASVSSMIEELPTVEEFRAMDSDAQLEAYNKTQAAYDAYMALSEEARAEISGAEETFETLFAHFNSMVMPVNAEQQPAGNTVQQQSQVIIVTMAALFISYIILSRRKR